MNRAAGKLAEALAVYFLGGTCGRQLDRGDETRLGGAVSSANRRQAHPAAGAPGVQEMSPKS
jgi:hypothetical protein